MPEEAEIKGQIEIAKETLSQLASVVSGKPNALQRATRVTRPEHQTALEIEQLDPIEDFVEIERLKIVKQRQTQLTKDIARYTKEYESIERRLIYRSNIGAFERLGSLLGGGPTHVPNEDEILNFIDQVIQASQRDYGEDCDAVDEYAELVSHVRKLGYALGIATRLKLLDEKLSEASPENPDLLDQYESELFDLMERQRRCRGLFSNLGTLDHPFNITIWNNVTAFIQNDLKHMRWISEKIKNFRMAIDSAIVEADLPSIEEITEVEEYIDKEFGRTRSPRFPRLRSELVKIKETISTIKDDKIAQAKREFMDFAEQFEIWRKTTEEIKLDFIENGGKSFPWRFLPPSQKEVRSLELKIEQKKLEYAEWPCVNSVISKKDFKLEHYERLLVTMKDVTEEHIEKALLDPKFPLKSLQHYLKVYRILLEKGGYDNYDELISKMRLRVFKFAHQQQRSTEWFSFFRRSYYDNISSLNWTDIAANVNGKNFGYSGQRTAKVLKNLGWLSDSGFTELAPETLRQTAEEIKSADAERVLNPIVL